MSVQGKVIFVTGGANGIGLAVAKELLKNNARGVSIVDISENAAKAQEEIETLFGKEKAIFIHADITDKKQLEDAFEKTVDFFKQLDIVFNNAGISNEEDWEKMINVNLIAVIRGSYLAMKKYLSKYKSGEEGIIVNTASLLGLQTTQVAPVYCSVKHGVVGLGQCLSGDEFYKLYKVRILTLCPGLVRTNLQSLPTAVRMLFPHIVRQEIKRLEVKEQPVEFVAQNFIEIIKKGKNGSVWIVENEQPAYEVAIPDKKDLQKLQVIEKLN